MASGLRPLAAVAMLLLVAGCGSEDVALSKAAVREMSHAAEKPAMTSLTLSSDDIGRLAQESGVDDGVIRDVAPKLETEPLWSRSLDGVRELYAETPEQVRSNLVSIACDGINGQIKTTEQLQQNILARLRPNTDDELVAMMRAVAGLWQDLYDASTSQDPQLKATAALTCFTVEHAVG